MLFLYVRKSVSTVVFEVYSDLELVLQSVQVFVDYGWTISEDICDLLDGEKALPPDEQHHKLDLFHRDGEDLGVMGNDSLKTPWGGEEIRAEVKL